MKFNFEKNLPKVEKPEEIETQLSEEEKQQNFEQECIAEANKLKVNLEDLKKDIDAFGGEEKFKEYFEKPTAFQGKNEDGSMKVLENVAGQESQKLSREIESKANVKGQIAVIATIAAIGVFMNMLDAQHPGQLNIDHNGINDIIQSAKEGSLNAGHYIQGTMLVLMGSLTAMIGKLGLQERFEARKLKRQQKIDGLKYKMTGTEVVERS